MNRQAILALIAATTFVAGGCSKLSAAFPCDPEPLQNASDCSFNNATSTLEGITLEKAYANLSFEAAVFIASVPDTQRLAVVEQVGRIKVFDDDQSSDETTTILDISSSLLYSGEQGLLGLAFDPEFTRNRLVYLYYSMSNPRRTVVSSMPWNPTTDQLDLNQEKIILEIQQPYSNHNGGMLAFGPDGYLYIGVGDGGSGGDPLNHGQNLQTLLGSILRIDTHPADATQAYAIPSDNPFIGSENARPEIFAYGLRNPFRFSFDRKNGDLWAGDVGQRKVEEIDLVKSGLNYGWRVLEGTLDYDSSESSLPTSAFTPPVIEYDHSNGSSVIGGYVYRGNQLPALDGQYLYADYVSGTVWALSWDGDKVTGNAAIGAVRNPSSFGENAAGELVIVTHNSGLFRLQNN